MFVEFKVVENYRSNFISENGVSLFKIADLNIHQTVNTSEICRPEYIQSPTVDDTRDQCF